MSCLRACRVRRAAFRYSQHCLSTIAAQVYVRIAECELHRRQYAMTLVQRPLVYRCCVDQSPHGRRGSGQGSGRSFHLSTVRPARGIVKLPDYLPASSTSKCRRLLIPARRSCRNPVFVQLKNASTQYGTAVRPWHHRFTAWGSTFQRSRNKRMKSVWVKPRSSNFVRSCAGVTASNSHHVSCKDLPPRTDCKADCPQRRGYRLAPTETCSPLCS